MPKAALISIIVPMYNESENIQPFYKAVQKTIKKLPYQFELLFVDDGSSDDTLERLKKLAKKYSIVKPIELARNFGKEIALSAGLHEAKGDAALMIDADLQHPPELISEFITRWEKGADMVVGVRKEYKSSWLKRTTSSMFYQVMNRLSDTKLIPHATDFRLVDRTVIDAFNRFTERNRITRGLFDWLGFRRDYIYFVTNERAHGKATYSYRKLLQLGLNSFVGHSLFPLKIASYIGGIMVAISLPLAIFIFIDRYILANPFGFNFSGSAILAVINLFMSGIILSCIGLMSLYIAHMHNEVVNRPLYITRLPRQRPRQISKD
jgi:glycosyltransferase involved in cell wall biosynthesis